MHINKTVCADVKPPIRIIQEKTASSNDTGDQKSDNLAIILQQILFEQMTVFLHTHAELFR